MIQRYKGYIIAIMLGKVVIQAVNESCIDLAFRACVYWQGYPDNQPTGADPPKVQKEEPSLADFTF